MGREQDSPMVGGDGDDALEGSELGDKGEPQSHVGPRDPDDAIDVGETGAEARSEQQRQSGD
jgi:hypothetical protein